jgi:hypothetical protein
MAENKQASVGLLEVILQELTGAQKTGFVTVQRSKAGVRDIGTITLLHGEVVEAHAGDRQGLDAVQWLYTWGRCQCEFLPQAPSEIVISPPPPVPDVADPSTSPFGFLARLRRGKNNEANESLIIQDLPSPTTAHNQASKTDEDDVIQKLPFPNLVYNQASKTDEDDVIQKLPFPNLVYNQAKAAQETPIPPSLTQEPAFRISQNDSDTTFTHWLRNKSPQREPAPYRLWQGQDALLFLDKVKASRLHRHVFLLLDGQRTIDDVVRITGHSFAEVKLLLNDLEHLGIIKQEQETQTKW